MTSPTRKLKEWWRDWWHQSAPTGLRPLHVVVLDDKAEACEAVRERVEHPGKWGLVRSVKFDVILHPIHVTLRTDQPEAPILERIYTFDGKVVEALANAQACCPTGPDLVFIDYGLADQQAERELIEIRSIWRRGCGRKHPRREGCVVISTTGPSAPTPASTSIPLHPGRMNGW